MNAAQQRLSSPAGKIGELERLQFCGDESSALLSEDIVLYIARLSTPVHLSDSHRSASHAHAHTRKFSSPGHILLFQG